MDRKEMGITKDILDDVLKRHNIRISEELFDRQRHKDTYLMDLSKKFHENSKITRANVKMLSTLESLFASPEIVKMLGNTFLKYTGTKEILLPTENMGISKSIYTCIANRRSVRNFTGKSIDLGILSRLLWHSYGITGMLKLRERKTGEEVLQYLRAAPSAGALYPIELYAGIINIEGVKQGLYHYNIKHHSLEKITTHKKFLSNFMKTFTIHPHLVDIKKACAVFVLTAVFWRQKGKYGPRGYRFALMEAGHIAQNIQLAAVGMDLGSVCVGGYFDNELNNQIGIDKVDEEVVYAVVIGLPEIDTTTRSLTAGESREEEV